MAAALTGEAGSKWLGSQMYKPHVLPAGNTDTLSAKRTPVGESSRQSPGKFIDGMGGVFPTQNPFCVIDQGDVQLLKLQVSYLPTHA